MQRYETESWNYRDRLETFVANGFRGKAVIDSVSRILVQGCHQENCAPEEPRMLSLRTQFAFMIINDVFDLKSIPRRTGSPTRLPTQRPTRQQAEYRPVQTPAPTEEPTPPPTPAPLATFAPVPVPVIELAKPKRPARDKNLIEIEGNGARHRKTWSVLFATTLLILKFT